jgi:SAM-dependent methyltransferase
VARAKNTANFSDAVERLRPLVVPRLRVTEFDPEVGYLDLSEERREHLTASTIAMRAPLVSAIYERWWRPGLLRVAKGITGPDMAAEYRDSARLLHLKHGDHVLDVACGPGNFTRRFARTVGDDGLAVGLDASRSMLERGVLEMRREGTADQVLVRAEATELPFVDGAFDSVCCFAALNMFPDPEGSLSEFARVVKPGGHLAILTSGAEGHTPVALAARGFGVVAGMRIFGVKELAALLEARGFKVEEHSAAGATQLIGAKLNSAT